MENVRPAPSTFPLQKWTLIGAAALASLIAGIWIFQSAYFNNLLSSIRFFHIAQVRVQCEWPLSESVVRGWLPPLKGKSLLTLDAKQLLFLLEEKTWVKSVTLRKEYPDGVLFSLTAKRAVAVELRNGKSSFIDENGQKIQATSPELLKAFDLPILSFENDRVRATWALKDFLPVMDRLQRSLEPGYTISQVSLRANPYFKVFLDRPRWEVEFSLENWNTQLPLLQLLLHRPPQQIKSARRFNLVFPKKAVVSAPLSK